MKLTFSEITQEEADECLLTYFDELYDHLMTNTGYKYLYFGGKYDEEVVVAARCMISHLFQSVVIEYLYSSIPQQGHATRLLEFIELRFPAYNFMCLALTESCGYWINRNYLQADTSKVEEFGLYENCHVLEKKKP